jgi:vancomycin resistance protein YoaR
MARNLPGSGAYAYDPASLPGGPRRPRRVRTRQGSSRPPRRLAGVSLGLLAGGLAGFASLVVLIFELATWGHITPGVTALGTALGGASRDEAITRLGPAVQQVLDRPLRVQAPDHTWTTTARDLGLRLEPADLADAAVRVGRDGHPLARLQDQLTSLFGGRDISVTSTTDQAALDTSLGQMAKDVERPPRSAKLNLTKDGSLEYTASATGLAVDIPPSRDRLAQALVSGSDAVDLVVRDLPPEIPDENVQVAHDQLERLFGQGAQPITLTFGQQTWQLQGDNLLNYVSLKPATRAGEPAALSIDRDALSAYVGQLGKRIDQPVQEARFQFDNGDLKPVRPSREGRELDEGATVDAITQALLGATEHTIALPVSVLAPTVRSDNPSALGIRELIDRGSTAFAGAIPEKRHNIQVAAQKLNGVVVPPGGTFSFNKEIGPTTLEAGFQWGFGITSGDYGPRTVPSVAGGICQVATTLFQPVFWAGYQLEERYWHLYWIPAYTSRGVVGLDATVDADSDLDFKWTNPTSDYVLIQASADDENVYFALYGKRPAWKVQVDEAVVTNRVPPDTRPFAQVEPTLPWGRTVVVETARDGFDVEVRRHVTPLDGGKTRDLVLKSTYEPAHTVTLVGTGGRPANANVEEALQRAVDALRPAEAKPSPTPAPAPAASPPAVAPTNAPAPTSAPEPPAPTNAPAPAAPKPTAAPTSAPAIQPTPAPKPAAPTPAPKPAPTKTP